MNNDFSGKTKKSKVKQRESCPEHGENCPYGCGTLHLVLDRVSKDEVDTLVRKMEIIMTGATPGMTQERALKFALTLGIDEMVKRAMKKDIVIKSFFN